MVQTKYPSSSGGRPWYTSRPVLEVTPDNAAPQGRRSQLPAAASAIVRSGQKPEMSSGKEDLRMANGKGAGLLAFIYPPEAIPEGKGRRRNKHRGSPS